MQSDGCSQDLFCPGLATLMRREASLRQNASDLEDGTERSRENWVSDNIIGPLK